jgi:hypothetical protein
LGRAREKSAPSGTGHFGCVGVWVE